MRVSDVFHVAWIIFSLTLIFKQSDTPRTFLATTSAFGVHFLELLYQLPPASFFTIILSIVFLFLLSDLYCLKGLLQFFCILGVK